jgi:hypothetical protein
MNRRERREWQTTEVSADAKCPQCGGMLDRAKGEGVPSEGDVSICIFCQTILAFNPDLTLRAASGDDLEHLTTEQMAFVERVRRFFELTRPRNTEAAP